MHWIPDQDASVWSDLRVGDCPTGNIVAYIDLCHQAKLNKAFTAASHGNSAQRTRAG